MPTVKLRTFNYQKAKQHGYVPAGNIFQSNRTKLVYWLIERRSKVLVFDIHQGGWLIPKEIGNSLCRSYSLVWNKDGTKAWYKAIHTERQFSDRYGGLSISATCMDNCNCVRFKKIMYSHEEERWDTIEQEVTEAQEDAMFAEACKQANIILPDIFKEGLLSGSFKPDPNRCYYGPNAIPYDVPGVSISFISKAQIWKPSTKAQWCTETVCLVDQKGDLSGDDIIADQQHPAGYHINTLVKEAENG